MTNFKNVNDDHAVVALDETVLDTVVGGIDIESVLSPQLRLAYHPVGGWDMKDIWSMHTI